MDHLRDSLSNTFLPPIEAWLAPISSKESVNILFIMMRAQDGL